MAIMTTITCDHGYCTNEQSFDGPYHIIKMKMKEGGWVNKKIKHPEGGEYWSQFCPDHRKEKS